jgi:hypothetical protein
MTDEKQEAELPSESSHLQTISLPDLPTLHKPTAPSTKSNPADVSQKAASDILDKTKIDDQFRWAFHSHNYVNDYIKLADVKAAFLFGAYAGLLGVGYKVHLFDVFTTWPWRWFHWIGFVGVTGIITATGYALAVITPRLRGKEQDGVIFWEAIASQSPSAYVEKVLGRDSAGLLNDVLCHIHSLSTVCSRKYSRLKGSIWIGVIAVPFFFVAVLVRQLLG